MMKALMIAAMALIVSSQAMATTYTVNATTGNDVIIIGRYQTRQAGTWVDHGPYKRVNGVLKPIGAVVSGDTVEVSGLAGNDYIEMVGTYFGNHTISVIARIVPLVGVKLFANGDAGDDEIIGGDSNDSIWGGDGDDSMYGSYGDDVIFGYGLIGPGDDFVCPNLTYNDDEDYCDGGNGDYDIVVCRGFASGGFGNNDECATNIGGTMSSSCEWNRCD